MEKRLAGLHTRLKRALIRRRGFATVHGIKVAFDPAVVSRPVIRQLECGAYEVPEVSALGKVIRPDDHVLELGGGIGFMSAFAMQHIDPARGAAVVYEANPLLIPVIKRTHALNGSAVTVENAVLAPGKVSGHAKFFRRFNFPESSLDGEAPGVIEQHDVPLVSFDEVLRDFRPTLLVVDIEGGEATVFDGVDLSCVRAAIVEFHPAVTGNRVVTEVIGRLAAQGLSVDLQMSRSNVLTFVREERATAA